MGISFVGQEAKRQSIIVIIRIIFAFLLILVGLSTIIILASEDMALKGTTIFVLMVFISMMLLPSRLRKRVSLRERDHGSNKVNLINGLIAFFPFLIFVATIPYVNAVDPTGDFGAYSLLFLLCWVIIAGAEHMAENLKRLFIRS